MTNQMEVSGQIWTNESAPLYLARVTEEEDDDDGGEQGSHGVVPPVTAGGEGRESVLTAPASNKNISHIEDISDCKTISHFLSP